MEQQDAAQELPVVHDQWGTVHHDATSGLAQVHLPLAQPLEQSTMPNLMPAITALIMQITSHLSQPNGNPQLALTFQPLVNMALNMQLQAWQQASTAHQLPVGVLEQMHMLAPQQAAGAITIESNVAPVTAEHAADAAAAAAAVAAAASAEGVATGGEAAASAEAQQAAAAAAAAAVQHAAAVAAAAQQAQQRAGTATGIPPAYRETYESEGTDGEEAAVDDDDEEYTGRAGGGGRRGGRSGSGGGHRPQRARKRNKLYEEYLTDDEEGKEEGGSQPAKQRRAHLE